MTRMSRRLRCTDGITGKGNYDGSVTEGYRILKDAKLYPACRKFFKSPLEFVHTMLVQARQANPLLYNFYSFKSAYVAAEKEVLRAEKGPKTP